MAVLSSPMGAKSLAMTRKPMMLFHAIDRRLYTILAMELCIDPLEALNIMAFWICLERLGFRNTVSKILVLATDLVSLIADEAITCLDYLTASPSQVTKILAPLTQRVISKELSLQFLDANRSNFITHLRDVMQEVCFTALMDIVREAQERNAAWQSSETDMMIASLPDPALLLVDEELPPPPRVGPVVHPDDRTLFVTFSRGYPVMKKELFDFFAYFYGDCVESIYMQEVKPGEQLLYARVVLDVVSAVEDVLSGVEKVKFTINGKHAWMRKFVPKNKRG